MAKKNRAPLASTRRDLIRGGAAGAAGLLIGAPAFARHRHPGELLNVASIGVGGMGGSDLASISSGQKVRIVALCDVDSRRLGSASGKHSEARTFSDWRVLLDEMGDSIDAVTVSTPDHMHGPISLAAMQLGKHVYCQKPIAHNLRECRAMAIIADDKDLVTQMGTQIHSHGAYRSAVATLRSGVIGKVSEAHLWVSKSWAGPAAGRPDRSDPVPAELDWDLWLGVAPERPFVNRIYHPAAWRGWRDFGAGTLGDMGCHIFDPVFAALGLGSPSSVTSSGPAASMETFAADSDITYTFPGTEFTTESLKMRWTDGSGPSRPDASRASLPEGVSLPGAGSFLVGEKGVMVIPHWSTPRLYSAGKTMEAEIIPMQDRNHYHEWSDACRGEGETSTPFSYSSPLTEAVLVGTIATSSPGREFRWDAEKLSFGDEELDQLVERDYREGWSVNSL
jgi:predicted dehydrogenase